MIQAKLLKLIGKLLCAVALVSFGYVAWHLIYSASSVTCLESKPGDTFSFGKALAINDNYIAVGDPKANRVAIYSYDEFKDKWSRTREIYPPSNSIDNRVGYGFGSSLVFYQNQLIIGAYSQPKISTFDDDVESGKYKLSQQYHGAVYSLLLNRKEQSFLQEIALPDLFELTGYSVTVFDSKIAIGATTEVEPYIKPGKVLIINPNTLEVNKIIEPPSSEIKFADFGFVIDGNDDFLLVGSRRLISKDGVFLIDKTGKIEKMSSVRSVTGYRSGVENSLFLRQSSKAWSLVDTVNFGGSFDLANSYLLISTDKETSMPTSALFRLVHVLVKLDRSGAEIVSKIRWNLMPDYKYEGRGSIYNNRLLLSHKGKVVLLSMQNLPRNYVINRSFCNKK